METLTYFIFLSSKITVDHDSSHKIKRCLFLERKAMINLDSISKERHHFADKGPYSQSYGFSSSHVWMWELDHKKGWVLKNECFQIVCWRRLLKVPWTAKITNQSVLNIHWKDWFPLGLTGLISFQSKGISRVFSNTRIWKHQLFGAQSYLWSNSHIHIDYWKNHSFDSTDLCCKNNVLLFNMLSRFIIAFLSKSEHLLILWLQSPTTVILEPKKIKSATVSIVSSSICHEVMGPAPWS